MARAKKTEEPEVVVLLTDIGRVTKVELNDDSRTNTVTLAGKDWSMTFTDCPRGTAQLGDDYVGRFERYAPSELQRRGTPVMTKTTERRWMK